MKTKYPIVFGLIAILMLVGSFLPGATPQTAQAGAGPLFWEPVSTPTYYPSPGWILKSPSDVDRIAIGSDGKTFYAVNVAYSIYTDEPHCALPGKGRQVLYKSLNAGITWDDKIGLYLYDWMSFPKSSPEELYDGKMYVWDIAVAPDDPNFIAVVTNDKDDKEPNNVWISNNGGTTWMNTKVPDEACEDEGVWISAIAISPAYTGPLGTTHDIAIGTRDADGDGGVWMVSYPIGVGAWKSQMFGFGEVLALTFSPNYAGDYTLVVVCANGDVQLVMGSHDVGPNMTDWGAFMPPISVELVAEDSPDADKVVQAGLDLPSDFNGDDPRSWKFFVFYDAPGVDTSDVYRLDGNVVYRLYVPIPTAPFGSKRIASFDYYGDTTQGKLLVGEKLGIPCIAGVQSWITLDPLACAAICWTSSAKPQTGGAGVDCPPGFSYGNLHVAWAPDGTRAYGGTSSAWKAEPEDTWAIEAYTYVFGEEEEPYGDAPDGVYKDETAFCVTRNDNLTWNQLSLIDTWVAKFTDVAPAADCSVLFLASVNPNDNLTADNWCSGFDSVWRTPNFDKPGTPLGSTWERVLTKATTAKCGDDQSNFAILRLAPEKTDGSVVFWAAGGNDDEGPYYNGDYGFGEGIDVCYEGDRTTVETPNQKLIMWSSDSGDMWAPIPRVALNVQDLAVESSTIIYVLDISGKVQKITYALPNWRLAPPTDTCLGTGKSIAALAPGHVLVGTMAGGYVGYSSDGASTFMPIGVDTGAVPQDIPTGGKIHVAFDAKFLENKTIYAADEGGPAGSGSVWRWAIGKNPVWDNLDPLTTTEEGGKCVDHSPDANFHGLAISREGTLYAAWVGVSTVTEAVAPVAERIQAELTADYDGTEDAVLRVWYTDQNGVGSNVNLKIPAGSPAGTVINFSLQPGDTGALEVYDVDLVGTTDAGIEVSFYGTGTDIYFGRYYWYDVDDESFEQGEVIAGVEAGVNYVTAVDRTLEPLKGTPKPGVTWSTLDYSPLPAFKKGVQFSLQPGSLKLCGCLTPATDTTLYAIDDRAYAFWDMTRATNDNWAGTYGPACGEDCVGNYGRLWMYTDCLAKKGPAISGPEVVECDPVSGRAGQIELCIEQLCLANEYQVIVAKDAAFTQVVWSELKQFKGPAALNPCIVLPPGCCDRVFECGQTYYWMARVTGSVMEGSTVAEAACDAVYSPWSAAKSFQVKIGLPVSAPGVGLQALAPAPGAVVRAKQPVGFSWSQFPGITEYQFQLAKDPGMTQILADATTPTASYTYAAGLDYNTTAFWRVRAVKPAPSDWSSVFAFSTEAPPPPPPVEEPPPPPAPPAPTPAWVWVLIAIGALLVIVTLILIVRTRRV